MRVGWLGTAAMVAALLFGPVGAKAQVGVRVAEVPDEAVRVDGSLRDWRRAHFARLGSGSDTAIRYSIGADHRGFYLAAEVSDERMVRTATPGAREDAIVLTFAMPGGRGLRGTDVFIYAGIPGRQAGSAAIAPTGGRPRPAPQVRVVEGPRRGGAGYVVEAHIPFSVLPGSARWQEGRLALRLLDVDSEARPEVERELRTAVVDPRRLDQLPTIEAEGGEAGLLRAFLRDRGLEGATPRLDLRGDVQGDARPERVVAVDTYVLVMGEGYRDGRAYDIFQLPIATAADVRSGRLVDLTGDGKKELALTLRQSNQAGSRDLWHSFSFAERGITPLFGIEVRKQTQAGFVEARLEVRRARRGGAPLIEVRTGRAQGLDPESFREASARDVEAILLPWGPVSARTYQWDGSRFATLRETENPRAASTAQSAGSGTPGPRRGAGAHNTRTTRAAPVPPSLEQMIAAFKQQAGLPRNARPRIRIDTNLAGGPTEEHLFIFGANLVVVGTDFRGGTGFFHFQIPVARAEDLVSVEARDLTGDGRAEVLIRLKRSAGDVVREILLVQQFQRTAFARLLMVEVGRAQGAQRIDNEVRVTGRGSSRVLTIEPGRATGWSADNWRFADGTGDGVEPLLLPWRDRAVRYRYANGRLSR